ncbi:MAG: restriction endonuclease subunit S [Fluviibacter sp.]
MKAGWQTNKLGEVCSFLNRGISPKYLKTGGICVLNQKCIRDHKVNFDLARRHDLSAKSVSAERLVEFGDVLINSTGTGTLGRVAQLRQTPNEPTTVDSHVTIARPLPGKFFSDFFGYMLVFIEEAIKEAGEGCGGQTELARSVLAEKFSVTYPIAQSDQERIVAILDAAFAGIATAKANAEKNLQNARSLFDSYLNQVFTKRGEGWVEKTLSEVCAITSTLVDPRKAEYLDLTHVGAGNIETQTGTFVELKTAREEGLISGKFLFDESMVLYSKIRPYLMKVARPDFNGLCSADMYPLSPLPNQITRNYLFHLLLCKSFTDYAIQGSARAGMPKVNREHLFAYRVWMPNVETQVELAIKLDDLHAETQRLESIYQQKLAALDALKKSLLHQAFSGQL